MSDQIAELQIDAGADARQCLFSPNGKVQAYFYEHDAEYLRDKAETYIREKRASACGDGKRLDEHLSIYASIYGIGKWVLRNE